MTRKLRVLVLRKHEDSTKALPACATRTGLVRTVCWMGEARKGDHTHIKDMEEKCKQDLPEAFCAPSTQLGLDECVERAK